MEYWFAYLRNMHSNKKMTARDYDLASVRQMTHNSNRPHRQYNPEKGPLLEKLSASEFSDALDRALWAVVTLFSLLTSYTKDQLLGCCFRLPVVPRAILGILGFPFLYSSF